jgi:hypothetical protein
MKETSGRRGTPACVKRFFIMLAVTLAFTGGCSFIMGPDEPAGDGGGNLSISLGGDASAGSRAITSGPDLPEDVLAAMRYDLVLTGPGGRVHRESISGAEILRMTVAVGTWRIDARAYQGDGADPAGTGSISFRVGPGINTVMVPMYMSGPCYEITVDGDTVHGTVRSNFTAAFAGTSVTITAEKDPDAFFVDGSLNVLPSSIPVTGSGPGTSGSFTMPEEDVGLYADFRQFVRYVRDGGFGDEDGTSWEDASGDLQAMMDELADLRLTVPGYTGPCIVKLAEGTYKPEYKPDTDGTSISAPGDRDAAFILRPGVQVLGGYHASGNGNRNPATNLTTLSGDLDNSDSINNGDAYHVVLAVNIPRGSETILDGLTIKGGNANVNSNFTGTSTWSGVTIYRDRGGGMYNRNSSLALTNASISGNSTTNSGGGMYNTDSSPVLINVSISGNSTAIGGGIYNIDTSSSVLVNAVVSGNSATGTGGGMYIANSRSALVNATVSGNKAAYGGGIGIAASASLEMRNSILWGNAATIDPGIYDPSATSTVASSIVQGSSGGSDGNVADPGTDSIFTGWIDPSLGTWVVTDGGDYSLKGGSPAINAGDSSIYPAAGDIETWLGGSPLSAEAKAAISAALQKDLAGASRFNGTNDTIDMGAYER